MKINERNSVSINEMEEKELTSETTSLTDVTSLATRLLLLTRLFVKKGYLTLRFVLV